MLVKAGLFCKVSCMDLVARIVEESKKNPGAYAETSVALSPEILDQASRMIQILFRLIQNPLFANRVLKDLPKTAHCNQGVWSLFSCCDYHLTSQGVKLIEINTHAGGGIAGVLWQKILRERKPMGTLLFPGEDKILSKYWDHFDAEWNLFSGRNGSPLKTIAIVDDAPKTQAYFAEFEIAKSCLEERGYTVSILDADGLKSLDGIDFVYNRCIDFYFEEERHAVLREALLQNKVCFSSNPRVHALAARKDTLVYLTEIAEGRWPELKLPAEDQKFLQQVVPETRFLSDLDLEHVWQDRKSWVFKPRDRYQAKGVYRGRTISRHHFDAIPAQEYIVQRFIPPTETADGLKTDVRFYHYGEEIDFGTARLYTGQVTNFKDPRGGKAPLIKV